MRTIDVRFDFTGATQRDHLKSSDMPTSLFSEMDRGANGGGTASLEDQRALQLALELSMLGLEGTPGCPGTGTGTGTGTANDPDPLQTTPAGVFEEARSKKSQNMTECVPVPSSEHVAEIVGRQGKSTNITSTSRETARMTFFSRPSNTFSPFLVFRSNRYIYIPQIKRETLITVYRSTINFTIEKQTQRAAACYDKSRVIIHESARSLESFESRTTARQQ